MSANQPTQFIPPVHPMDESKYNQIVMALQALDYTDQELRKAKQAGLDVDAAMAQSADTRQKLLGLKNTYYPNR